MGERPDYYAALGVSPDADASTIKRAYRRLAAAWHPDRGGTGPEATRRFQRLVEAYHVLGEPERRRRYDAGRRVEPPRIEPGTPIAELFGMVLDQLFGVVEAPEAGRDRVYRLRMPFTEAVRGGRRTLWLPSQAPCRRCEGRGFRLDTLPTICERCGGDGRLRRRRDLRARLAACPDCAGRGYGIEVPCPGCDGGGHGEVREPVAIDVPPGVRDHEELRVRGAGEPGPPGGSPGDCRVRVRVAPHPVLRRRGADVEMERPVTQLDAMAGSPVTVPTVAGPRQVALPERVRDGAVLRLPGLGVPGRRGGSAGDQYVRIRVEPPESGDPAVRATLRRAASEAPSHAFPATRAFEAELADAGDDAPGPACRARREGEG